MNEMAQVFMTFAQGFSALSMTAYLGGAWVCAAYRRLSPMLIVASGGFAGLFAASSIARFATFALKPNADLIPLLYMGSSVLNFLSAVVLVFGLGASLADLRRQLANSLELNHGRR